MASPVVSIVLSNEIMKSLMTILPWHQGQVFIQSARDLKRTEYGEQSDIYKFRTDHRAAPQMWQPIQVSMILLPHQPPVDLLYKWVQDAWRSDKCEPPSGVAPLPPDDLIWSLIGLFFRHVAPTLPVLDRRKFENAFHERQYRKSSQNEALLLLVCAIGSTYSIDPRIASNSGNTPRDGWRYFLRGRDWVQSLTPATLAELQIMVVSGPTSITLLLLGTQSCSKLNSSVLIICGISHAHILPGSWLAPPYDEPWILGAIDVFSCVPSRQWSSVGHGGGCSGEKFSSCS